MAARTMMTTRAVLVVLVLAPLATATCVTNEDCSLNGVCTSGTCRCDPGWAP